MRRHGDDPMRPQRPPVRRIPCMGFRQMQAMQMAQFTLLPSFMLSGFMFPFRGMPVWAQWIGELLPATHFLRVVRGILLKGNGFTQIWPDTWPLILFLFLAGSLALLRFRRTLD